MTAISKLALGTAQFGFAYGIANTSGQVPPDAVAAILDMARQAGIDTLDTAVAYGESEGCLGRAGVRGWKIITKLPPFPGEGHDPAAWVRAQVDESLSRLNVTALDGLLLHRPGQLLECHGPALYAALEQEKARGRTRQIGISIYHPGELDALWSAFRPGLVQAPLNVFDQRLITSGWLDRLVGMGVEVHARSVYLQGLLVLPPARRPSWCAHWRDAFAAWDHWLARHDTTAAQAAFAFVFREPRITRVVVGIDSPDQCAALLEMARNPILEPFLDCPFETLAQSDESLLNPAHWPRP